MSSIGISMLFVFSICSASWVPLVTDFMKSKASSQLVIFTCSKDIRMKIHTTKELFSWGLYVHMAGAPADNLDSNRVTTLISPDIHHISILLDLDCPKAMEFWSLVTQIPLPFRPLGPLANWLLISKDENNDHLGMLESTPGPGPGINSNVFFAQLVNEKLFNIYELYRIGFGRPDLNRIILASHWQPGNGFPPPSGRDNLMGATINMGIYEIRESWKKYRWDLNRKHFSTPVKISVALQDLVDEHLNLRMKEILTKTFGKFLYFHNRSFDGLLKLLHTREVEIISCMAPEPILFEVFDITDIILLFKPYFIFRNQPISSTENIYILPFSKGVWLTTGATLIVCTFLLLITSNHKSVNQLIQMFFTSLAILFDQGSEDAPKKYSGRIIFFTLLILTVFLFNAYSASIVVLLQTPSTKINDLKSLMESSYKLTMENVVYNHLYYLSDNEPIVQKLYKEHILVHPEKEVFLTLNEGMDLVRKGFVAFHVTSDGSNKVISDKYEEEEKCNLKQIRLFKFTPLSLPMAKNSTLREVIMRSLVLINENGLADRTKKFWSSLPFECYNRNALFTSVSLQDFYPTLVFFAVGLIGSVIIFICEVIYTKYLNLKLTVKENNNV